MPSVIETSLAWGPGGRATLEAGGGSSTSLQMTKLVLDMTKWWPK